MTESTLNFPRPNPDEGSLELTEEYIRVRAYQIYERRGRQDGHDVDDWLLAEAEIMGKKDVAPTAQEPELVKSTSGSVAA
jgi:hypothetical protein